MRDSLSEIMLLATSAFAFSPSPPDAAGPSRNATAELDEGWPCALSASTEIVAPGRCRFLDDDVASLPEALRGALEAAASKAVDGNGKDAPRLAHQGAMASPLSRGAQGFLAALRKGRDKVVTVARAAHASDRQARRIHACSQQVGRGF